MSEHHTRQSTSAGQADRNWQRNPRRRRPLEPEMPREAKFCWCGEQHGGEGKYKYAGEHPWGPLPEPEE